MNATLIEIDPLCPRAYWYANLAGRRLWARPGSERAERDCWVVLPGQDLPADFSIFAEHAWAVREALVELRLVEVSPDASHPS
jgi:hypothetical protein